MRPEANVQETISSEEEYTDLGIPAEWIQTLQKLGFKDYQIYVSFERLMKCGVGKCGHCMIEGKYTCRHGPVFRYDEVKGLNG